MKILVKILSVALALTALCACGGPEAAPTTEANTVPTTTAAPTESKPVYPEPDKLIALTFDDGPNEHMDTIVNVFAEYGGKATFYVIGNKVSGKGAEYVQRAYESGHEIGNHSYNHVDITQLSEAEVLSEISLTPAAVKEAIGVEPVWYRPPFGKANDQTFALIPMPHAYWGVSVGDGSNDNIAEDRYFKATSGAYDGAIVLLHCNDITAGILPQILHELKMQGYEFVTTSELFARVGEIPVNTPGVLFKDNKAE